jgi:diadenylate cyclase
MTDTVSLLGWRDVVDVLLVAAVVYRVLLMFRGTRAAQMLVGLALLVAVSLIARRLQLRGTQWLLDHLWSFWVVVVVVLFQPEFRRALERLGRGRVLQVLVGGGRAVRAHVVDEVTAAVETLATRRIGALVVMERSTGLGQYADLGVRLDARVSADLLVSIFVPASPLHDGAVLLSADRVTAAGCFLPLSRSLHVGRTLGTRHRAALGATEETDAVAVVVSEETASISVAVEGQIERLGDAEALGVRLDELLGTASPVASSGLLGGVRRLLPWRHHQA